MAISEIEFATKCILPKRNPSILSRRRLLDALHSQVGARTQVLVAPAGYGKTTLLVDFAGELEVPVCWYSVDATDQDARSLVEGLLSSVKSRFPDFGKLTSTRLESCKELEKETPQVIGTLTGELCTAIPDYCVLVLEDFQNIESSPQSLAIINQLLERAPDNCHVIISSRTPLELPALTKLRMQQTVAELNTSQMAFTPEEAKSLLAELHGISLTEQETEQLTTKTEGWILGILLSTYSLRAGKPQGQNLAISHKDVYRYLTSEVYDCQIPELQSFLLVSSTLDQIEPEICDRLLGSCDTLRMLRAIEKDSLFVQCVDHDQMIYRYHQIFRDFLQRKLMEERTEQYFALHAKAGLIFEEFGRRQEAIAHLLKARAYDAAANLIKHAAPDFIKGGKWSTVSGWIEALPEAKRADDRLTFLYAQSLIYLGKADQSIKLLSGLLDRMNEDKDHLLKAECLSWRSAAYRLVGLTKRAQGDIETAISIMECNNGPAEALGDAYRRLASAERQQGKFKSAVKNLQQALKHYTSIFDLAEMSETHNSLGIYYTLMCRLEDAGMHYEKARQGWSKIKNFGGLAMTLANASYIYQRRGQYDMAQETLRLGLLKAQESGYLRTQAQVFIATGEILRDIEKYKEAIACYQKGLELAREVMEAYYVAWAKAGLGETYRLLGNRDRAEILIKEAIAEAKDHGLVYEATQFITQLGIMDYEKGDYQSAVNTLTKAAKRFAAMRDKDALAKTCFHLAQAHFLAKRYDEALDQLKKSCDLATTNGYDEYMVVEGKKTTMLMEYAISKNMEAERLTSVIERLRQRKSIISEVENQSFVEQNSQHDIEARAFGEANVLIDGRLIDDSQWRSHRAKEIFFFLLCSKTAQSREAITTAIWPDLSPSRAASNFHINTYRIRRAIHPRILVIEQGLYRINPSLNIWFDVNSFEQAARRIHESLSNAPALLGSLEEAVDLYKGHFLSNMYSEWAENKRKSLEEAYFKALALLARLYGESSLHAKAIETLEKYIAVDPYQDDAYCQLMEQHLAMNDEVSASRIYKRFSDTIATELDSPPSTRMRALRTRLTSSKHN